MVPGDEPCPVFELRTFFRNPPTPIVVYTVSKERYYIMKKNVAGSREKLLEAAQELFLRQGYQPTSVDQLLAEAGVAPSNFYYHFKGKEELALEVIERYMEAVREATRPMLADPEASPTERLRRLHRYFLDSMVRNDCCGG